MQSHFSVAFNAAMTAHMHGRAQGDVVLSALPCPHVYGNVVMNSALLNGLTLVLHSRFEEQAVLESIARHRVTILDGVPAMYMTLLNHAALAAADLSSLRLCAVGGQTMPIAKMEAVKARFGCPIIELWGMTELAGLGTTFFADGAIRMGSIGVPLPGVEVRIADLNEATRTLAPHEPGELMVRGPIVMMGYFGNDAATRQTIEPDGWLHTGDIARMDEDGFVHLVDRQKDMILTAGYNIYPAELERVVAMHPAVAMVAVGPVPDEVKGEIPKAYIVLNRNASATAEEIIAHCREHLASYKIPRQVQFVSDLPRTSTGKLMRRSLRLLDVPHLPSNPELTP
jgi:long-chain acyl-CoA synthetase